MMDTIFNGLSDWGKVGSPGAYLSAITGRWRSGQDFPRWIALGDRFTAANLNPALARPGHHLPLDIPAEFY